ncbi:alkaline phosphatase family protein [Acidiphilium sp. AL]|uniref:phospholipase C n=1 Tax=Acidiphilium sp. AL TaxID=2871704 RepID=UPI0021CB4162|nr:alkaline phosphatase family protein [Acidiphilium sp. AL]MCU4162118.1 alkaline phosphatase family protein [Acidiphilium sp. AL]
MAHRKNFITFKGEPWYCEKMVSSRATRREIIRATMAAGPLVLAAPYIEGIARASGLSHAAQLRGKIDHIVVIFQENRSFDHYFGTYRNPNGKKPLNLLDAEGAIDWRFLGLQKNPAGISYSTLPMPIDVPALQRSLFRNLPFHIGPYVPATQNIRWDPQHRFFRMSAELNNGRMDRFVAFATGSHTHLSRADLRTFSAEVIGFDLSRPSGPVLGFYDRDDLPFYHRLADRYTLFDRFFQAMTGGSTGNALYLVAARSCVNPHVSTDARSPFDPKATGLDHQFFELPYDHYGTMVNDLPPSQGPTSADNIRALKLSPPPSLQTYDNIGDRLTRAGVSWAWFNENWNLVNPWALKTALGSGDGSAIIDTGKLYEGHHNPFQYYPRWPAYVRRGHIRSSDDFFGDAASGKLPGVSFVKASGAHDEHPANCPPAWGMAWVERLVRAMADSPAWNRTAIIITYDEGGGFWDQVAPPQIDAYGLGTRIPAILVSPYARIGFIDHHVAHTGSVLKLIETRFGLAPLNHRDREAYDMSGAFDWDQRPNPFPV